MFFKKRKATIRILLVSLALAVITPPLYVKMALEYNEYIQQVDQAGKLRMFTERVQKEHLFNIYGLASTLPTNQSPAIQDLKQHCSRVQEQFSMLSIENGVELSQKMNEVVYQINAMDAASGDVEEYNRLLQDMTTVSMDAIATVNSLNEEARRRCGRALWYTGLVLFVVQAVQLCSTAWCMGLLCLREAGAAGAGVLNGRHIVPRQLHGEAGDYYDEYGLPTLKQAPVTPAKLTDALLPETFGGDFDTRIVVPVV
jgi:hypothetical protein